MDDELLEQRLTDILCAIKLQTSMQALIALHDEHCTDEPSYLETLTEIIRTMKRDIGILTGIKEDV